MDGPANGQAGPDSRWPAIAHGRRTTGGELEPWLAFSRATATGRDVATVNNDTAAQAWSMRGTALDAGPGSRAERPALDIGGAARTTPWMAFAQTVQSGRSQILAATFAAEQWDLVGEPRGGLPTLNVDPSAGADHPDLAAGTAESGDTSLPWITWDEATAAARHVFVRRAVADATAMGGYRWQLTGDSRASATRVQAESERLYGPVLIRTSCAHVNGWEKITEIQFRLSDDAGTVFLGKYVAAEDKVYVEDPDHPGTFLGGRTPGSPGGSLETRFVRLDVARMSVANHGFQSAALDINWYLEFKAPAAFRQYTQAINIGYTPATGGSGPVFSGFFSVGILDVSPERVLLPVIMK